MLPYQPLFSFLLLLYTCCAIAQTPENGWEYIRQNNFSGARAVFEAELSRQPDAEPALCGMLFLAETVQDMETYEHYANQLTEQGWKPQYVWLFGHLYGGTPEKALQSLCNQSLVSGGLTPADAAGLKLPFVYSQADSLFKYRRFGESTALLRQDFPDWNWSLTGPFDNESGSAFIEKTGLETAGFDVHATFKNAVGTAFGWLQRTGFAPGEPVTFEGLPNSKELGTYLANTFITIPTARRMAFRITREEPIQIWLDDRLIMERSRTAAAYLYDNEIVEVPVAAGTHRLLVRLSEFPKDKSDARIRLNFNDVARLAESVGSGSDDDAADEEEPSILNGTGFLLRCTDPATGAVYTDIISAFEGNYTPATENWDVTANIYPFLNFWEKQAKNNPDVLWKQYLLAKAFARCAENEAGEDYFSKYAAQHTRAAFSNFLLAKFYNANDKAERAEALLSEMDTIMCPTLAAHYIRLFKINKEQDENYYLTALEKMMTLSPANFGLMSRYLTLLKGKGRREQIRSFTETFMRRDFIKNEDRELWKKRLESYTEDESYKPASYKPKTEKEREKDFKRAQKTLKKTFSSNDFNEIISYHKYKDHVADVLKTYDEWLLIQPWRSYLTKAKAKYLFEKERADEALLLLQSLLNTQPYDAVVLETIGDIYVEKKNPTEAIGWYRRAEKIRGESYGLRGKMEKIENKKKLNGYFPIINLEEIARAHAWDSLYADEEAVIALFSQQMTYLPEENKMESANKAIIHIRTDGGVKAWTEANLRPIGRVTSAKVLKKDGAVTSPELGYGMAVFKNLQPGDIILVEGVSEHNMPDEIPNDFLEFAPVSWQSPVARATIEILAPKELQLYFACNRLACTPVRRDTANFQLLQWNWSNLAKPELEDATPENYDSYAWLMAGSAPDWNQVARWYERKTYCRAEPNYEVLDKARELIRPGMSEADIVEALHTFIVRDISYSYVSFLNSNYVPKKPGATLSAKVGDCKDVATLMIALLREQGIPAWYTLVSTHSFSNREPRPTPYVFNHAIVAWQSKDGQLHFADLTTDYFPTGVLPRGDCGAWALVIREGETQLRRLPDHALDATVSGVDFHTVANLDAAGNLTLTVQTERKGVAAGHWREQLLRTNAEERRKALSAYFGGGVLHHLDVEDFEFFNTDSLNEPLKGRFNLKAYHQLDQVSNLYILPLPLPFSTPTEKGMFAAKRYNDMDLNKTFELSPVYEKVELTLPKGFVLAELPKDRQLDNRFGTYHLSFEKTPAGLLIHRRSSFKMRFLNYVDFTEFKQFYLDMLDADDAFLALKKM